MFFGTLSSLARTPLVGELSAVDTDSMDAFIQRMSSMVIGKYNSTSMEKQTDDGKNDRQEQFDKQQRRRLSAPDMRRRGVLNDRVETISNQKGLSTEHIDANEMFARLNSTGFRRRHGYSMGESTVLSFRFA